MTRVTSQPAKFVFITLAQSNMNSRLVTDPVFHFSNPLPVNDATLRLPSLTYAPPAAFLFFENANFMLFTPLVSQSPRAPHLVVAGPVFRFTQSHDACLNVTSFSRGVAHISEVHAMG